MIKQTFLLVLFLGFLIGIGGDVHASNWDYSARCIGGSPYQCHNALRICNKCTPGRNYCRPDSRGNFHCVLCPRDCKPPCKKKWGKWSACSKKCGVGTQSRTQTCTGAKGSQNCKIKECEINGQCNSAVDGKEYPFGTSVYDAAQCTKGTSSNTAFPDPEQTETWTCSGQYGGVKSGQCSAAQLKPDSKCGSSNGITEINIKADVVNGECDTNNAVNESVTFNKNNGKWEWTCAHEYFHNLNRQDSEDVDCSAPSCLAGNLIKYNSNVYLKGDLNNQKTNVSIVCNDPTTSVVCCDINSTDPSTNVTMKTHVCTGDSDKEIFVASGTNTYPAKCYIKPISDSNPGCEDGSTPPCPGEIDKSLTISTICSQKECNAQGSCQSTPMTASNLNQCSSTCNSNADCSSGRLIETRP